MKRRLGIFGIGLTLIFGLMACGKEDSKKATADPEAAKAAAEATEMQKKQETVGRLSSEQQFLDLKFKAVDGKLEKQGNKTKKKLKPKFSALEAERVKVAGSLERLLTLAEQEFTSESNSIRVSQDSLSSSLMALEKSMK